MEKLEIKQEIFSNGKEKWDMGGAWMAETVFSSIKNLYRYVSATKFQNMVKVMMKSIFV